MGYYTDYKIIIKDPNNDDNYIKCIKYDLREEFDSLDYDLETRCEWYSHEEDLKQFSTRYPDVLFILTGIGEEHYFEDTKLNADIWIMYFVNGKSYTDKLDYTFSEFDSSKLK